MLPNVGFLSIFLNERVVCVVRFLRDLTDLPIIPVFRIIGVITTARPGGVVRFFLLFVDFNDYRGQAYRMSFVTIVVIIGVIPARGFVKKFTSRLRRS